MFAKVCEFVLRIKFFSCLRSSAELLSNTRLISLEHLTLDPDICPSPEVLSRYGGFTTSCGVSLWGVVKRRVCGAVSLGGANCKHGLQLITAHALLTNAACTVIKNNRNRNKTSLHGHEMRDCVASHKLRPHHVA